MKVYLIWLNGFVLALQGDSTQTDNMESKERVKFPGNAY